MLTSRGITLLSGALLAWLVGRTLGVAELYAVAVAVLAVVALGVAFVRVTTGSVAARRQVEVRRVVAGAEVPVLVQLRNDGRIPSPTLLVTDPLPEGVDAVGHPVAGQARFVIDGLRPGQLATAPYTAVAGVRGRYRIGPLELRVRDPFGAAERVRRYSSVDEVVVYPRIEPLPPITVRGAHMGSGSSDTRRVFATGDDFYTMREYVSGDDLRRVHWPSTAHRQVLMVRQMEQPWQAHGTVFLDARRMAHTLGADGTLEKAVSVAASLLHHLDAAGYALRLVTDRAAGRGGRPEPVESAMDALAVLDPSDSGGLGPALAATRGGEGLFVAVLGVPVGTGDLGSHPDVRALLGVRGFGHRIAVVLGLPGDARAERTAALLRAAGWRAAATTTARPLADVWADVTQPGRHPGLVDGVGA
ncbi:DUF58 domain-containing protein [Euzebya sp.]|uniref:DUF58 domain-containing protein n=1 Tax=Euzebya sp. TaxID=1971409 RepID=UPI0035159A2D